MAIYHMHLTSISRGKGKSAVAHAAYISGQKLRSSSDGSIKQYGREERVNYVEIILPPNAPPEYKDPETLWNAVESEEKNPNARLARSLIIALPNELTPEENIQLSKKIAKWFAAQGMCVQLACHNLNGHNPHVHMLVTVRRINKDGHWQAKAKKMYLLRNSETGKQFYGDGNMLKNANTNCTKGQFEKVYRYKNEDGDTLKLTPSEAEKYPDALTRTSRVPLDTKIDLTKWDARSVLKQWRKSIEITINDALTEKEKATGQEIKKISSKSLKDQGLTDKGFIPQIHEGVIARKMEERGEVSDRSEINRQIKAHNAQLAEEYSRMQGILQRLINTIKERMKLINDRIRKELERINGAVEAIRSYNAISRKGINVSKDDQSVNGRKRQTVSIESQIERREQQIKQRELQLVKLAGKTETRLERYAHLIALAEACDVAYAELKAANLACESTQLPTYYQAKPHEILEKDILSVGKKPRIIGRKEWNEQCNIITKKWRDISLLYNLDIDLPDFDALIAKKEELVSKIQAANKQYNANIKSVNDNRSNALKASQDADEKYNLEFNKMATDDPVLLGCGLQIEPKGYSLRPVHEVKASLPMSEENSMRERVQVVFGKMRWEDTIEYQSTHKHKNIDKSVRREDEYSRER